MPHESSFVRYMKVRLIEAESPVAAARSQGRGRGGNGELVFNEYKVSVMQDE